jgi:hypothetical protein
MFPAHRVFRRVGRDVRSPIAFMRVDTRGYTSNLIKQRVQVISYKL